MPKRRHSQNIRKRQNMKNSVEKAITVVGFLGHKIGENVKFFGPVNYSDSKDQRNII